MSVWTFDERTRSRLVPLSGANNFRDLGGWRTSDGRSVRHGRVFRAATLHGLTPADHRVIAGLGIGEVVDLRSPPEVERYPTRWPDASRPTLWEGADGAGAGDLSRLLADRAATLSAVRTAMLDLYRSLPVVLAPAYRRILHTLADGSGPLLFHCSAGKDRTGVGSAILLQALDVRPEDVRLDYLLTNDSYRITQMRFSADHDFSAVEQQMPGVLELLFGAHDELLDAAAGSIAERFGGFDAYLAEALGIDADARERLRDALLD